MIVSYEKYKTPYKKIDYEKVQNALKVIFAPKQLQFV